MVGGCCDGSAIAGGGVMASVATEAMLLVAVRFGRTAWVGRRVTVTGDTATAVAPASRAGHDRPGGDFGAVAVTGNVRAGSASRGKDIAEHGFRRTGNIVHPVEMGSCSRDSSPIGSRGIVAVAAVQT